MKQKRPENRRLSGAPGKLRIIAGRWRGRRLTIAAHPDLRPTPDRIRETLFNWLGQDLTGAHCLDLFAGSGALGFEAASRGASRVVMVEQDRLVSMALEKAREMLEAANVSIVRGDAVAYLKRETAKFDVVFLDPPFRQNALPALLGELPKHLAPLAKVYVESPEPVEPVRPWRELKRARAGQVSYQLLEWSDDDQGRLSGNV